MIDAIASTFFANPKKKDDSLFRVSNFILIPANLSFRKDVVRREVMSADRSLIGSGERRVSDEADRSPDCLKAHWHRLGFQCDNRNAVILT